MTAYEASKAALNYIVRKIHFENPDVRSWVLSSERASTGTCNHGAEVVSLERVPVSLKQSVESMLEKVDYSGNNFMVRSKFNISM